MGPEISGREHKSKVSNLKKKGLSASAAEWYAKWLNSLRPPENGCHPWAQEKKMSKNRF